MKIENRIREKSEVIDSSNIINQYLNIMLEEDNNKQTKTTITKKRNQGIYQTIRTKASIISNDQRDIQDKISLIQDQEQRIIKIENTLEYTKKEYSQVILSGKKRRG